MDGTPTYVERFDLSLCLVSLFFAFLSEESPALFQVSGGVCLSPPVSSQHLCSLRERERQGGHLEAKESAT